MEKQFYDYGMIGLGTMGLNLVYNMCDHNYTVAGFDNDLSKLEILKKGKGNYNIFGARNIKEFLNVLKKPRVIMLLVPAGPIVDIVIDELKPLILSTDIIMDCGNSHFTDTDRRIEYLAKDNIHFMGVGVSGGESGARYGPSIMPGGAKEAYERVAAMLEAVSAKVNNEPCVTYIGRGSAGHYVKMVHNGIEYALMQLIAEVYQLLKEIAGMSNDELHDIFSNWNDGQLRSYLIEITAAIFTQKDDLTQNYLIDMILDSAHQKGTGKWMSQNAMDLQVPVPAIDAAVSARDLSAYKNERITASQKLKGPVAVLVNNKNEFVKLLEQALYFSIITTYSQGISLLHQASKEYKYDMKPEEVVKIWRGGCIIRASVLESIRSAFQLNPDLPNLMIDKVMAEKLMTCREGLKSVVKLAVDNGIPIPGLMASMAYYDGYRKGRLPSGLLQAQRDFFGAHTYQRIDREGDFHTQWNQKI
jgi:6-phosphogluconate dehydrogenase